MTDYIDSPTEMTDQMAIDNLYRASMWPYDATDAWIMRDDETPPPIAEKWSIAAARAIIYNLLDRRGIKQELQWHKVDEDVRKEIVNTIAAIIDMAPAWYERSNKKPG